MNRSRIAVLVALLTTPGIAAAQLPTESAFASRKSFREEYLEHTLLEVNRALLAWTKAVETRNLKDIKRLATDDLLFGPLEGWLAKGPEALDSLKSYLPRISAFGITLFDFDAGGSMASVYASIYYQLATGATRETVIADAAIVLVQRGPVWRIRSYVERPRPVPSP
ncbi:MAG: nuclear transport factor 2 family protein [Gemmatimonadales bacterium]